MTREPNEARLMMEKAGPQPLMIVAIFFRAEGWYPTEYPESTDWAKEAERNPGTLRIENLEGDVLWRQQ